ncbi:DUF2284 domain-containing protein [Chloroflexota bacterium]
MDADIEKYCKLAVERGATHAKQVSPDSVVTAPWVRWKCQFGSRHYGRSYCCPPDSPKPEDTRALLDCYQRAILFHFETERTPEWKRRLMKATDMLRDLEGEIFKDGYYKALVLLSGPCLLCKECGKIKGDPCSFQYRIRPCMEACGIDVFQTARNNGFSIHTLRDKSETTNHYCMMLVD